MLPDDLALSKGSQVDADGRRGVYQHRGYVVAVELRGAGGRGANARYDGNYYQRSHARLPRGRVIIVGEVLTLTGVSITSEDHL